MQLLAQVVMFYSEPPHRIRLLLLSWHLAGPRAQERLGCGLAVHWPLMQGAWNSEVACQTQVLEVPSLLVLETPIQPMLVGVWRFAVA